MCSQADIDLANKHVAFHEAGHAVMWALLQRERPEIFPLPAYLWLEFDAAAAEFKGRGRLEHQTARRGDKEVAIMQGMISLAGPIAEMIEFGRCRGEYKNSDLPRLHEALTAAGYSVDGRERLIEVITHSAQGLLQRENVRIATRAVADELLAKRRLTDVDLLRLVPEGVHK